MKVRKILPFVIFALYSYSTYSAEDQDITKVDEAEEIAEELADPNSTLGALAFNYDYTQFSGDSPDADKQSAHRLTFQPVLPYSLAKGLNMYFRPAIPLILAQDVPHVSNGKFGFEKAEWELGDIGYDLSVGKTFSNGIVVASGVAGSFKTASNDAFSSKTTNFGPEFGLAKVFLGSKNVIGAIVSHQWNIDDHPDGKDYSVTAGQYFYTVNLGHGLQINTAPVFSYNHEAIDNKLTLPIGTGISKTTIVNNRPWQFGMEVWYYVASNEQFAPEWLLRFSLIPVVGLPW